ncbi:MAG: aspartyl protease family protein [Acidobacteriia bacterium]|nr:aspartyl protease family protein [Terriglobia bacterium]
MRRVLTLASIFVLAGLRAWSASDVELAFDFIHNQIVLRAMIEDRGPFNFVLDTGTYTSTIDTQLARELGLRLGPQRTVAGAGTARNPGQRTVCPELRLGDLVVHNLDAVAIDLAGMSEFLGRPLHGVLGFSFLSARAVRIDYFRRRIRFSDPDPSRPPSRSDDARFIAFPMVFRENSVLPVLQDCYVNGARLPVTIDTGSSLGLILFPQAVEKLGLRELARAGIPMQAGGYLGRARLTKGWATSVKLKTIDLGAIEVAYVQRGYGDTEQLERRGGNLGNAVLQDFILTLDYPGRTVTLESTAE